MTEFLLITLVEEDIAWQFHFSGVFICVYFSQLAPEEVVLQYSGSLRAGISVRSDTVSESAHCMVNISR